MTTSTTSRSKRRAKARNAEPAGDPRLGPEVQAQLGTLLRRMYGHLLNEPVPGRFLEVLKGYGATDLEERP
jgi:hypothetical protein